jgi:hypothetical protein
LPALFLFWGDDLRKALALIVIALLTFAAGVLPGAAAKKKSSSAKKKSSAASSKKSGAAKASASKKSSSKSSSKASAKGSSKTSAKASSRKGSRRGRSTRTAGSQQTWRSRQLAPNSERYTEIQQALVDKGYLQGPPSGQWDQSSIDALRRFQQEQNLEPSGKINSLSLIALGLGPKYDSAAAAATPPPHPPQPQQQ